MDKDRNTGYFQAKVIVMTLHGKLLWVAGTVMEWVTHAAGASSTALPPDQFARAGAAVFIGLGFPIGMACERLARWIDTEHTIEPGDPIWSQVWTLNRRYLHATSGTIAVCWALVFAAIPMEALIEGFVMLAKACAVAIALGVAHALGADSPLPPAPDPTAT